MINSKVNKDYLDNLINFVHIDEKFNSKLIDRKKFFNLISKINLKLIRLKKVKIYQINLLKIFQKNKLSFILFK